MRRCRTDAAELVQELASKIMTDKKITPQVVKKIEVALEERKPKSDRRGTATAAQPFPGSDRRAGKDRRDLNDK